jgi:hypothetical protein
MKTKTQCAVELRSSTHTHTITINTYMNFEEEFRNKIQILHPHMYVEGTMQPLNIKKKHG